MISKKYFFSLFLFFIWVLEVLFLIPGTSFSVLTINAESNIFHEQLPKRLMKGDVIEGSFISPENNLGIVRVKFHPSRNVSYDDQDILVFRIKEQSTDNWLAVNEYKSGLIESSPFFPFGFLPLNESQGKKYLFEIESTQGNSLNAVTISDSNPIVATQHKFSKEQILGSPLNVIVFIYKKVFVSFTNVNYLILSLPYLVPFLVYILKFPLIKKTPSIPIGSGQSFSIDSFFFLHVIFLSIILSIVTLSPQTNITIYLLLTAFWVITVKYYKTDYSVTIFYTAIIFGITVLLSLVSRQEDMLNISSTWTYLLLLVGSLQLLAEQKIRYSTINLKSFFKLSLK